LRNSVLDSSAVLAFLHQERGYVAVPDLLARAEQTRRRIFVSVTNWAEVRYRMEQRSGKAGWEVARRKLLACPLEIVPADQSVAELAGEIKVTRKMSLADCFAAALAKQRNADLYTGDPEFRAIEKGIRIAWL